MVRDGAMVGVMPSEVTATRTIILESLPLTRRKIKQLMDVSERFVNLVKFFIDKIHEDNIRSIKELHQKYYNEGKKLINGISTIYISLAMRTALDIYKGFNKRKRRKMAQKEKPEIKNLFLKVYHTNRNEESRSSFKFLITPKRVYFIIKVYRKNKIIIPLKRNIFLLRFLVLYKMGKLKLGEPVVKLEGNTAIIYMPFRKVVKLEEKPNILTIDVNTKYVVVSIFNKETRKLIHSEYLDLREIEIIDNIYVNIARKIQKKLYSGHNPKYLPRWVREIIKKRLRRWYIRKRDLIHKLTKYIVDLAEKYNAEIVMEDIRGIKQNIKDKFWNKDVKRKVMLSNFRKIQNLLEYKALWKGINVKYVNPKNTSKVCPVCGSRLTPLNGGGAQGRYLKCNKCGLIWERDFVATLNLAKIKMGGVTVTHDSPVISVPKGAVLPNGVRREGNMLVMIRAKEQEKRAIANYSTMKYRLTVI